MYIHNDHMDAECIVTLGVNINSAITEKCNFLAMVNRYVTHYTLIDRLAKNYFSAVLYCRFLGEKKIYL